MMWAAIFWIAFFAGCLAFSAIGLKRMGDK